MLKIAFALTVSATTLTLKFARLRKSLLVGKVLTSVLKSRVKFADAIKNAKTILWNGPAGVFEFDNFAVGSKAIADAIVEATKNGAFSLVGGGDSVACVNKFGYADQVSYVSTGGGALLEAIEGKVLPGVAAIKGE